MAVYERKRLESQLSPGKYISRFAHDKPPTPGNTLPREAVRRLQRSLLHRAVISFTLTQSLRFGEQHMKKVIVSLAAASIALVSVQAFAQASDAAAPAAAASAPKKHHVKKLKTHGKRAPVAAAASAAGTNDKGTQN